MIRKRIEYQVSKKLGDRLFQKFEISLSELEVSLVAVLLLSYRKDLDIHAESDDFRQLKLALEEFLSGILNHKSEWRLRTRMIYYEI